MNKIFMTARIFTIMLLFLSTAALAQERNDTLITGQYEHMKLAEFLHKVEAQTPYYFYYDSTQKDSIEVHINATKAPLSKVLQVALQGSSLHFSIDRQHRVFLTSHLQIVTKLPPGFNSEESTSPVQPSALNTVAALEEKKKTTTTSSENRLYEIGTRGGASRQGEAVLSGYIRNAKTGEPLVQASIFVDHLQLGTVTNQYGFY
jgi:hypothetical protein